MRQVLNIVPASLVALVFFLSGSAYAAGYANPALLVETSDLATQIGNDNVRIVDVRSREAYKKGHIPSAVHLGADDVIDPNAHVEAHLLPNDQLAKRLGALGIHRNTKVVLYDDKGGFLAARLFWMLEHFGHRRAAILNGGLPKWQNEGRDVTDRIPPAAPSVFVVNLTPRRLASADWVLDRRDDPSAVVIDVRPSMMYQEGHIPWAKNIPWKQNLAADGTMKSADALQTHFAARGVTKDKNVAVHCQNGKAAAHSYFTLRLLGYARVRSYDRSWVEWQAASELPRAVGKSS